MDGIGSGVLARNGKVFYTCIPDLWQLDDTGALAPASGRRKLSSGYGVHVGFLGHDLHGLTLGMDGRVYFSIGDRGLSVDLPGGGKINLPDTGAVLRCEPDGSKLELFAFGLRNPQELAFDDSGELFTGDNNSDGGDQARWVHLVEGSDSGWRIGWQFLEKPMARGAWNLESMWKPRNADQPAYVLPPLANVGAGPSGLAAYPGTGLDPRYQGVFLLCDFRGGPGGSGIHAIWNKQDGAGYRFDKREQFLNSLLVTDVGFAPWGEVVVSDWIDGWGLPTKGRIYALKDQKAFNEPLVKETAALLGGDLQNADTATLVKLLDHADRRVRTEAHLALSDKGAVTELAQAAEPGSQRARVHAVWGIGRTLSLMCTRSRLDPGTPAAQALDRLIALAKASDSEVRMQVARVLGEIPGTDKALMDLLADASPRVSSKAALSLARQKNNTCSDKVMALLEKNNNSDLVIRHSLAMALHGAGETAWATAAAHGSAAVRLGAVLALRRAGDKAPVPLLTQLLADKDTQVATEAARAAYETASEDTLQALAAQLTRQGATDPAIRRSLAALRRLGTGEAAKAVAAHAAKAGSSEITRVEAMEILENWAQPIGRDALTGLWRPGKAGNTSDAADAIRANLGSLLSGSAKVRSAVVKAAGRLGLKDLAPTLASLALDMGQTVGARVEAMDGLAALDGKLLEDKLPNLMKDPAEKVRAQAYYWKLKRGDDLTFVAQVGTVSDFGAHEQQAILRGLLTKDTSARNELLASLAKAFAEGKLRAEAVLEIREALEARPRIGSGDIRQKLAAMGHDDCLQGGDPEAGKRVFLQKAEVSCLRCHQVGGTGGIVGPALDGLGGKKDARYLLESIVEPSKAIAEGFQSVVVELTSGKTVTGVLRGEDADSLRLVTAEGVELRIPKKEIEERSSGPSAMPADLAKKMSRRELRDVVEYLKSLK
ncbi:MAG: HEAT repeat domain-containing protein [Gemmataceae bacterium]